MNRIPDIRTLVHESRLLKGNPMGDPHVRRLPVYVPPGYDEKRKEPYPVVFLLAGYTGRGAQYLNDAGVFAKPLQELLDAKISADQMPPVLVAFPDAGTRLGGSQFINSAGTGPYMDYVCDELVELVDSRFHTHKSAAYRGVSGHSSGGFGSLVIGMMRPDRFLSVCSSAGDTWHEYLYMNSIPLMIQEIKKAGGVGKFIEKFTSSPNPTGLLSRNEMETMMNLAMCSCYAPNPKAPPLFGDLYFDLETGELIPEVWKKFLDWDPVNRVDRYVAALKKLKWIHLEAGTEDEYGLHIGHRRFAKKLKQHGIPYKLDEYPGKHGGHTYRYVNRIALMLERMYSV